MTLERFREIAEELNKDDYENDKTSIFIVDADDCDGASRMAMAGNLASQGAMVTGAIVEVYKAMYRQIDKMAATSLAQMIAHVLQQAHEEMEGSNE